MYPVFILENQVKKTNWYKNDIPNTDNYPGDKWYRVHLERNYDVVNIGSSSAVFCFDYDGLDVKAFNWALKPQSMEYGFKVLKQYFSILKKNGVVIIPFSPFSGLSVDGKWSESANDKYFHIIDKTLIDNYESVAKRRMHPFRSNPIFALKKLVNDSRKVDMYGYNYQCISNVDFENSAKKWIEIWTKEFNIQDLNAPLSNNNYIGRSQRLNTVKSIIRFCKERDLHPIIVVPPVHCSLNKYFSENFVENYIFSFFDDLNMTDLRIVNYLKDERFNSDEYFRDSFFMNKKGAKMFTKQVLLDLNIL